MFVLCSVCYVLAPYIRKHCTKKLHNRSFPPPHSIPETCRTKTHTHTHTHHPPRKTNHNPCFQLKIFYQKKKVGLGSSFFFFFFFCTVSNHVSAQWVDRSVGGYLPRPSRLQKNLCPSRSFITTPTNNNNNRGSWGGLVHRLVFFHH